MNIPRRLDLGRFRQIISLLDVDARQHPFSLMKIPYPKKPNEIIVRIINRAIDDGVMSPIKTTAEVPLHVKLNDYIVRLGYSSTNLVGFVVQLFTHGKVRIDFASHSERLELVDPKDRLSGSQAMSLLEDYMKGLEKSGLAGDLQRSDEETQQIIVRGRPDSARKT
jgi:hypothetical protein